MTFFRQAALLLPSAFLLGALLFLLTHGSGDAGFGVYPFFEEWGGSRLASGPQARFLQQSLLFFAPLYVLTLLFLRCVAMAESALFGPPAGTGRSPYAQAFARAFAVLYLVAAAALVLAGDGLGTRYAPGALIAPLLAALAPFLAAAVALLPAALLAAAIAAIRKAEHA